MRSNSVLYICRAERAEMLLCDSSEASQSVLTHHQHKHTDEERRERRESYIRYRHHSTTAAG